MDNIECLGERLVPDKALDTDEIQRMILGLVENLPPEQRMAVLCYYYDEMSIREIAQAIETSEGTVKSRLNYAHKSIKTGLESYERKGIRLYSAAPLPLLFYFLRKDAAATCMEPSTAAAQDIPFGLAHGFPIVEPQAYEDLPVTLALNNPALVPLPSTSTVTQLVISVSSSDEAGYMTYTVTYDIMAQSHLGSTDSTSALSGSILAQEYNLYNYYTGRLYQPDGPEIGASSQTVASGSAAVEHNGLVFPTQP